MSDSTHADIALPLLEFGLVRDAWGHLTFVDAQGTTHSKVATIPLFPVSQPGHWIALVDTKGVELALIESLDQLPTSIATLIREELSFREFVPRIQRVISVSGTTEPCQWHVETDRGQAHFVLNSEEDIRRVSAHVVQIVDATGIRFRVDDTRKLDARSRRYIEWYV